MQMVMVIVGGHVVASTPALLSLIQRLAGAPHNSRGAVAWIALFSMLTSLLSWGLSLIFSGLLVREMAYRIKGLDYRAAGAEAYLGLGVTWAMGLSSTAAMLMATRVAIRPSLLAISGIIPLSQTFFLWPSLVTTGTLMAVAVSVAYLSAPSAETRGRRRTTEYLGLSRRKPLAVPPGRVSGWNTTPFSASWSPACWLPIW
jgi:short-chain fatty acids transporter